MNRTEIRHFRVNKSKSEIVDTRINFGEVYYIDCPLLFALWGLKSILVKRSMNPASGEPVHHGVIEHNFEATVEHLPLLTVSLP